MTDSVAHFRACAQAVVDCVFTDDMEFFDSLPDEIQANLGPPLSMLIQPRPLHSLVAAARIVEEIAGERPNGLPDELADLIGALRWARRGLFFEDGPSPWTGPPLTDQMVRQAESALGVRLPHSYVGLLRQRNGGVLRNVRYPTPFKTQWASDHAEIHVVLGVGHAEGADAQSAALIAEWDYPQIGVVIGVTALAGPDTIMLDYSACGADGEPTVAYVWEGNARTVAGSFGRFMDDLLETEPEEDDDDLDPADPAPSPLS